MHVKKRDKYRQPLTNMAEYISDTKAYETAIKFYIKLYLYDSYQG